MFITQLKKLSSLVLVPGLLMSGIAFTTVATAHDGNQALQVIVLDRDAQDRARDKFRNPVQTLTFFHVEPGMKVAEALPGGGWYSKILAKYLGAKGELHGINYNEAMWPMFGFSEERIKTMSARTAKFPELIEGFTDNGIKSSGFTFATAPASLHGTLDRVLFVRALHNVNRFEEKAGTRTQALKVAYDLLAPNGLVGVVQHKAPETASDKWADGSKGYLKQSTVIKQFEDAGFELVMTSEINVNENDKPGEDDVVWRLPPSVGGGDEATKAKMAAIGESSRMTLLFKKKGGVFNH